ncbi:hypothetical protein AMTRI_Chr03g143380 [Amborella trichopoda]
MPTFTAIALDRLLEHSTESSSSKPPATKLEKKIILKPPRSYILPTLYATPEATPIPDSPSSFPPSPYVINHKRRGPRLSKSYLQGDGLESAQSNGQEKRKENGHEAKEVVEIDVNASHKKNAIGAEILDETSVLNDVDEAGDFLQIIGEDDGTKNGHVGVQDSSRTLCVDGEKEDRVVDCEDFFDPQNSISVASHSELEENCGSGCISKQTPVGEFFDACEEMARRHRQTRKRRKKWLWSMVGITIAFGTAAIMWSYIPHAHCREVEQEQQVVDLQMQE